MPKYFASHPAKDTSPSRDRLPKDHPLDADILIQIGPVDTDAVANQSRTANGSMTANSAASACCAK